MLVLAVFQRRHTQSRLHKRRSFHELHETGYEQHRIYNVPVPQHDWEDSYSLNLEGNAGLSHATV